MKTDINKILIQTLNLYTGAYDTAPLGGTSLSKAIPGTLSADIADYFDSLVSGEADTHLLPESDKLLNFEAEAVSAFYDYYGKEENFKKIKELRSTLFNSEDPVSLAAAVSKIWSPELMLDDDQIFDAWQLQNVKSNPEPYKPEEIIIQLNALYSPAGKTAPDYIDKAVADTYNEYMLTDPEKIAVYDHPVPVFTQGAEHELEKCLIELDADLSYEKECGVFPKDDRLKVLISISTTHRGLDEICDMWLQLLVKKMNLKHLNCYLLSENKARSLEAFIGSRAGIFTVQGKYACHFGALKYAQLIFEKAWGIRAGFKLDTDEGIHSEDMKNTTGKTWLQQLCHPYWGGTAENKNGRTLQLGFNIGEYVDSRDLDALGFEKAIRTPEVKPKEDMRGPYLIFNKGICQAKGTMLLNRTSELEDFVSHPLVKGGGYGIDNAGLRKAVPVGFSMVGRAEDQQFYYSAVNQGVQGIFNPFVRIIHYKAAVAKSEHQNAAGRNIADIYRMLLFRELMTELDVTEHTQPFPANYASELSKAQAFFLWLYLIFTESAKGNEEAAGEYLSEGISELLPLLEEIDSGKVLRRFEAEKTAWGDFIAAVDEMSPEDAASWLKSLEL